MLLAPVVHVPLPLRQGERKAGCITLELSWWIIGLQQIDDGLLAFQILDGLIHIHSFGLKERCRDTIEVLPSWTVLLEPWLQALGHAPIEKEETWSGVVYRASCV